MRTWNSYGVQIDEVVRKIHDNARKFFAVYRVLLILTIEYFDLMYYFNGSDFAIFRGALCDVNSSICYWTYVAIVFSSCTVLIIILVALDGMFFGIIIYCYCEFKVMKYALKELNKIENPTEIFNEFTRIVRHHSEVLK